MGSLKWLDDYAHRDQVQNHISHLTEKTGIEFFLGYDDLSLRYQVKAVQHTTLERDIVITHYIYSADVVNIWPPNLVFLLKSLLDRMVTEVEEEWQRMLWRVDVIDVENLADEFAKGGYPYVLPSMSQLRLPPGSGGEVQLPGSSGDPSAPREAEGQGLASDDPPPRRKRRDSRT